MISVSLRKLRKMLQEENLLLQRYLVSDHNKVGTDCYMAPEVLRHDHYGKPVKLHNCRQIFGV